VEVRQAMSDGSVKNWFKALQEAAALATLLSR
jgi:hypothetical protein